MSHLGYFDPETDSTPLPQYVEAKEANRKAHRALWRGFVAGVAGGSGLAVALMADFAWGETIQIGRQYIHGESFGATTVTIEPSTVPGQLATVTLLNKHVNQGTDTGDYGLTFDGVVFGIEFEWDANPLTGADRITVIPPDGILCEPQDCSVTVMEGFEGTVTLYDWRGM